MDLAHLRGQTTIFELLVAFIEEPTVETLNDFVFTENTAQGTGTSAIREGNEVVRKYFRVNFDFNFF